MPNSISQQIQENYRVDALVDRVQQVLEQAGLGSGRLPWSDLAPLDQFHVRGLEASKELADALNVKEGQSLLDVGSGLGGPARYLAAVHRIHVTGIDLTPAFIEVSNYLSHRAGLGHKLTFRQGDATDLPFADETFDLAWTQHVAMNIQDKAKLYQGVHRVLKTNGRFAIYDPIKGNNQPILYPTPWAPDESISFVSTEEDMKEALASDGFKTISLVDKTAVSAEWFQHQRAQPPNPLSLPAILGPELGAAVANFARNLMEGRVRLVQIIADK